MRILYVGSLEKKATALFYYDAFRTLGHDVRGIDPNFFECQSSLNRARMWLTRSPLPNRIAAANESLLRALDELKPEIIFVMNENYITSETVEEYKDRKTIWIYHSHDNNFSKGVCKPTSFFETLSKFDRIFTTKSLNVAKYSALGINSCYIPSAYEPKVHRPLATLDTRFDISFIGTFARSRLPILNALGWENLWVWGDNWKRYSQYLRRRKHITPYAIYGDEYAEIMGQSRISLGLLREEAEDLHTQRTFEIPACGALQVAPRNAEMMSLFSDGEEILLFSTIEELIDKVKFALENESARQKIAKAGFLRVTQGKNTYTDRAAQILKEVSS